jgi:hypothetical protein
MTLGSLIQPTDHCVLLGRGGATNNHIGNKRFRAIVASHQEVYLNSKKKDKAVIARRIVGIVQSNGGQFLRKNTNGDWEIVENKKAVEKTSQALREGLNVRRTTAKSPRRHSESSTENTEEPFPKRLKVGKTVSWEEPIPSLKEYDSGEATTIPDLEDEASANALFHQYYPSAVQENCEYIESV